MNCKPGDLAIIVRDPIVENVGRVVGVVGVPECLIDAPAWSVEAVGGPLVVINIDSGLAYRDTRGGVYDADLLPITGIPVDDEVKDEVPA